MSNEGLAHKNSRARRAFLATAGTYNAYSRLHFADYRTSTSPLSPTYACTRPARWRHPRSKHMVAARTDRRLPNHCFRLLQRKRPRVRYCLRSYRLYRQ